MKKIISLISGIAMFAAISGAAMAADKTPVVYVDTCEIVFADQEPVILGEGTTLVPARGVFETMGAKVTWDGDARTVEVESGDHNTIVTLTIDSDEMVVADYTDLFSTVLSGQPFTAPKTTIKLDVPAQIMNDRTMIPLRAISEAINSEVKWDGDTYTIDIKTPRTENIKSEDLTGFSITSSSDKADEGETVDILVNVNNLPSGTFVSGVTAAIKYNTENFEFVDAELMNGDTPINNGLVSYNTEYAKDCVRVTSVTINADTAVKKDDVVMKITFKSLNGKEGSFELSNSHHTGVGYGTYTHVYTDDEERNVTIFNGVNFNVDTTPVIVNAETAE